MVVLKQSSKLHILKDASNRVSLTIISEASLYQGSQVPIEAITRAVISDKTTKKFFAAEDNAVLALFS